MRACMLTMILLFPAPCTHIYKANDLRLPVVAFHCRHLHRHASEHATVTLRGVP